MGWPLVLITIAYSLGIVSATVFPLPVWLILPALLIFLLLLICTVVKREKASFLLLILFFLVGMFAYKLSDLFQRNEISLFADKGYLSLIGQIVEEPKISENNIYFQLAVEQTKYKKKQYQINGKVFVSIADPNSQLTYGDKIEVRGIVSPIRSYSNPFLPQPRQIYSVYSADWKKLPSGGGNLFKKIAIDFSRRFNEVLNKILPPKEASLLGSILLGSSVSPLEDEVKDDYRKAGLIHLLVVSGTQVSIMIGVCLGVTRAFALPLWLSVLITSFFNIMLVIVTGGGPSILRAGIMGEITLLGLLFDREKEFYTALALSALILLIISPTNLFDIGFQLSFAATWALFYIAPVLEEKLLSRFKLKEIALPPFFSSLLSISLAPILATFPVITYNFGQVSLGAVISNLLVLPWVEFMVVLGFSTALLGFIFLPAAKILAETIWLLLWFLEKIATGVGKMPGSFFYIGAPSLLLIGAYYSGLIMVLEYLKKDKPIRLGMKNAMTIALAFAAILVWNGLFSPTVFGKEELTVTFIDVGQGDAILIETPQGKKILIDGSGMERREINDDPTVGEKPDRIGRKVVLPFLRKKGINRLDLVFLTHPHEDHLGGLNEVLKAVKVNQVIDAGSLYNSLAYQRFKELIAANKIKYAVARMGQEINFGNNLKAEILWPGREQLENVNSNSIVMRLVYGEVAFLFTGDLEKEGEERLLKYYSGRLHSTVLKVGHHGSLTSTGDDFLRAIGPKYAVISVGKRNRYQHPAASTIKRLIEHWIKVFRTDLNGAITVRTDGCRLAIATQK